jgi:hypothetical protein
MGEEQECGDGNDAQRCGNNSSGDPELTGGGQRGGQRPGLADGQGVRRKHVVE